MWLALPVRMADRVWMVDDKGRSCVNLAAYFGGPFPMPKRANANGCRTAERSGTEQTAEIARKTRSRSRCWQSDRLSLTSRGHRARVHFGGPPPLPLPLHGAVRRGDDVVAAPTSAAANAPSSSSGRDADGCRAVAVIGSFDGGLDERGVPGRSRGAVGRASVSV